MKGENSAVGVSDAENNRFFFITDKEDVSRFQKKLEEQKDQDSWQTAMLFCKE